VTVQGDSCGGGAVSGHPNSVMVSVVHTLVCDLAFSWRSNISDIILVTQAQQRSAFRLFRVSLQWSEFTAVSLSKKLTKTTSFSSQITVTMIIPTNSTPLNFFSLGDALWLAIPLTDIRIHV